MLKQRWCFYSGLPGHLALRLADYAHPQDVVFDGEITHAEKRAILAAWASDMSAVDSRPSFRWLAGTPGPIALSQILAALKALDILPNVEPPDPPPVDFLKGLKSFGGNTGYPAAGP